jgi:hypothetical protein
MDYVTLVDIAETQSVRAGLTDVGFTLTDRGRVRPFLHEVLVSLRIKTHLRARLIVGSLGLRLLSSGG